MLRFCLIELSEHFNAFDLEKNSNHITREKEVSGRRDNIEENTLCEFFLLTLLLFKILDMHPYHLSRKVKIKRFVARPETSCENSHCQVDPWIGIRSIAKILLKIGLIFSSQGQISYLQYFKRGKRKNEKIHLKIVLLTHRPQQEIM